MAGVIKRFQSERAALLGPLSPRQIGKEKEEIKASGSKGQALHAHQGSGPTSSKAGRVAPPPAGRACAQNGGEACPDSPGVSGAASREGPPARGGFLETCNPACSGSPRYLGSQEMPGLLAKWSQHWELLQLGSPP